MARVQDGLVLLFVLMGCLQAAIADANCQSSTLFDDLIHDCFVQNDINLEMPPFNDTAKLQKYLIDAAKTQEAEMCSNKDRYTKIVQCLSQYAICVPDPYKPYLPSTENLIKVWDALCDQTQKLNDECVLDKSKDLSNCALLRYNASGPVGPGTNLVCLGFRLGAECFGTELRSCGCSTVKAMQTVFMDLLYPSKVCAALTTPRAQCDAANPQQFAGNGGQSYTGWAVPFFVSSLLVVLSRFVE